MVVHRAMVLIGDSKQATGEGKSGPVETGLTGPAATALSKYLLISSVKQESKQCCSSFSGNKDLQIREENAMGFPLNTRIEIPTYEEHIKGRGGKERVTS